MILWLPAGADSRALPTITPGSQSVFLSFSACPAVELVVSTSPLVTGPTTQHGTRPAMAMGTELACVAFIR
jgi:hypothetical protein